MSVIDEILCRWKEIPDSKTECSNHCGPGTYQIRFRCVQIPFAVNSFGPLTAPNHACYHLPRPEEEKPCVGLCKSVNWKYGEWGACSTSCGNHGLQYRSSECVNSNNETLTDDHCPPELKVIRRICGGKPCPKWDFGPWTSVISFQSYE